MKKSAGLLPNGNIREARPNIVWNDELRKIYTRFPSILRSRKWPEIAKLALSGDADGAWQLAQDLENRSASARIENSTARRLRIQRVALFNRIATAQRALRVLFDRLGTSIANKVEKKATGTTGAARLSKDVDELVVELRVEMRKWLRKVVKDSTVLGLRNAGDAFQSQFEKSKKAREIVRVEEMILMEASPDIPFKGLGGAQAKVKIWSKKWSGVTKKIVKTILKSNALGRPANENIVEISARAGNEMKKIIANNIAQGVAPATIARKIKKFMNPEVSKAIDLAKETGETLPAGVYKSTFKNAMRLARTEANKAYSSASAEWAKDKPFITGIKVTLSPLHSKTDVCDSLAGRGEMSPEEFQNVIPAHPHCMCYPTYVYKDRFLDTESGE